MSQTITISLPDPDYVALRAAAARANQSPEEFVTATIRERFGAHSLSPMQPPSSAPRPVEDPVIAMMRARGHLVEPSTLPRDPARLDLPAPGSPEERQLLEEIGREASDALDRIGLHVTDLVER
jgi:hypothetical protein